jgi:prepilin signal peptidase PulO-like enzyme (type II secretory pathway)
MKLTTIEKRAVRTGIKASKKRGHVVSGDELLDLRVQMLPNLLRAALIGLGIALICACYFAWPSTAGSIRGLEAVSGIFSILFGAFGIRRTLSHVLDSMDAVDLASVIGEVIADALSNIDL